MAWESEGGSTRGDSWGGKEARYYLRWGVGGGGATEKESLGSEGAYIEIDRGV